MKSIALIAFILALGAMIAADDIQERVEKMKKIHGECQADPATKVDEEDMEKFFRSETIDEAQFAKHTLCMNKKLGLQKENGDVDKDNLRKSAERSDKVDEIVEECGQRKGTAEETALAVLKCIRKYLPKQEHH